jgi:hypothetical protein
VAERDFSVHVPDTIPVQVIATDANGDDHHVGDFSGGIVLNGMTLQDVKSHSIVAAFSVRQRAWIVKGNSYRYIFCQVMPID